MCVKLDMAAECNVLAEKSYLKAERFILQAADLFWPPDVASWQSYIYLQIQWQMP